MKPLKIIFAGTPAFALPCLQALHHAGHNICAVFTQPDRPAGRGQKEQASVVKQWALTQELPIYQPQTLKDDTIQQTIAELHADVMVVVAYGLILPKKVLALPKLGCINVHGSLLPKWRGAAPIQYAIREGDNETGITIMQMDEGMDTGDILTQESCIISDQDTSASLFERLSIIGANLLCKTLERLVDNKLTPVKQDASLASYAPKIAKTDAHIDWQQSSQIISQKIRAYYPWPIAYTTLADQNIKIHKATIIKHETSSASAGTIIAHQQDQLWVKTGDGVLAIESWQWPNQKVVSLKDWFIHKALTLPVGNQLS